MHIEDMEERDIIDFLDINYKDNLAEEVSKILPRLIPMRNSLYNLEQLNVACEEKDIVMIKKILNIEEL